jgi:amidase
MHDIARERAKQALEGPLAGVPFLIKDLYQDYAGVQSTSGCLGLKRAHYLATEHSEVVRRWLAAGLVIFGRTNTPEFGAKGITEPVAWGPTKNPWNLEHSPGGSSGGAAAAVAARIVPVAGASDGGGSIRIPAASTGLFGLKPGRGRTPCGPHQCEIMHGAPVNHVHSRSVRDSACFLDAIHGPELGSPYRIAPPERPYLEEVGRDPGKLRIAFNARSPIGTEVDPAVEAALDQTARKLESLGHSVEPATPAIDGLSLARDFLTIWFASLADQVAQTRAQIGPGVNDHGF